MNVILKTPLNSKRNLRQVVGVLIFLLVTMISCDKQSAESNPYDKPHDPARPVEVSDIGPEKGGYGTRVVISGSNFGNDSEKVRVTFNEKEALILAVQDNAIYAMCPKQPGDFSTIKVVIQSNEETFIEAELDEKKFEYFLRATTTTIAGVFGKNEAIDGPAMEASFQRPAKVASDIDGSNLVVVDDRAHRIRLISMMDNKVVTVSSVQNPFSIVFNPQYDKCFVGIRAAARRPELFVTLSKENNYMTPVMFYDQKDDNGNYIVGNADIVNIASDDIYVYLIERNGGKFVRVHQETGRVELIGQNLDFPGHVQTTYNPKDKKIYVMSESSGRLSRFDPYHTPADRTVPWLTHNEMEYVLGNGVGAATEGFGEQAVCPCAALTTDRDGNVYGADFENHVIWKFDVVTREAKIFAGIPQTNGYKDGKPLESLINRPLGLTVTADGIVYVADTNNFLIRCVSVQ